jgi:hypothetical protein
MAIDYTDPCAICAKLKQERARRAVEGTITRVGYGDKSTEFDHLSADGLIREITYWEGECAKKTGGAPNRFAIRAGSFNRGGVQ